MCRGVCIWDRHLDPPALLARAGPGFLSIRNHSRGFEEGRALRKEERRNARGARPFFISRNFSARSQAPAPREPTLARSIASIGSPLICATTLHGIASPPEGMTARGMAFCFWAV